MKFEKDIKVKLSIKDRVTIYNKKKKPLSVMVCIAIVSALFLSLIFMTMFDPISAASSPTELSADNVKMRITIAGDICIDDYMRSQAQKSSYKNLLRGVSNYWKESDYVMANVNGPILKYNKENYKSTLDKEEDSIYLRPAALRGLADAGINVFSFANDSVFNYGRTGISSTINLLNENHVEYLGIANNSSEELSKALNCFYWTENGEASDVTVTLFSINDAVRKRSTVTDEKAGVIDRSIDALYEQINEASNKNGHVIVYVHFKDSESGIITDNQRQFAHLLIDSGADVVIGSHPHSLQSVEKYADGIVAYGLGNLISSDNFSLMLDGALADYVVSDTGEANLYFTPVRLVDGCPVITSNIMYEKRIQNILSNGLEKRDYFITEEGAICIPLGRVEH